MTRFPALFAALWVAAIAAIAALSGAAFASRDDVTVELTDDLIARMAEADIVLLGEVHDNADHHAIQARIIAALESSAVV